MKRSDTSCVVPVLLLFLLLFHSASSGPSTKERRRRLIDGVIRDAAFRSYPQHHKTGVPYEVALPATLSLAAAHAVRFRAGRLRQDGVAVAEFRLFPGLVAHPHVKRLLLVVQNLGNLSASLYFLSGYQLASPVLGLLIYDASRTGSAELNATAAKEPIAVDFSWVDTGQERKEEKMCAVFQVDGRVELSARVGGTLCATKKLGHIVLVEKAGVEEDRRRWKTIAAAVVAAAVAAALLGLVLVAMVKGKRKRWRMAEMERRAYENEALQVSMVGHVRAPTAPVVRTAPELEKEYMPPR